jgi:hypothetical protein
MFFSLVLALALSAPVTESSPQPDAPAPAAGTPSAAAAAEAPAAPAPDPAAPVPPPPAVVPPPPPAAVPPPPAVVPPPPPAAAPPPPAPVAPPTPGLAAPAGAPPSAPRRAPFPPAHSFHAAVGLGRASAGGSAESGVPMSDLTHDQVELQLEVGFRFAQRFYLDLYVEAGGGDPGGAAAAACASDCAVARVAAGIETKLAFAPRRRVNPWIGIGVGVESLAVSGNPRTLPTAAVRTADWHTHDWSRDHSSSAGSNTLVGYTGLEFPRLSAGVDWRLNRIIGVGAFANLSFTRYDTITGSLVTSSDSVSAGTHTWFTLGVRAILFP